MMLAIVGAVSAATAIPASAALDVVLSAELRGSANYDSNLFRSPDDANPQVVTLYTGTVGLHVNKPYAQQRFQSDIAETAYRYEKSSDLDFDALNYRAAWLWHYGPRVSGTLEANRAQSQVSFQDTTGTTRNTRTTKNYLFNLDREITAPSHFLFGISQSDQSSENPTQAAPNFQSTAVESGVRYVTASDNWVSLV